MAFGDSQSASLAAINAAIDRCLLAQSYGVQGRNTTYAKLSELMKLREQVLAEEGGDRSGGAGVMFTAVQPERPT